MTFIIWCLSKTKQSLYVVYVLKICTMTILCIGLPIIQNIREFQDWNWTTLDFFSFLDVLLLFWRKYEWQCWHVCIMISFFFLFCNSYFVVAVVAVVVVAVLVLILYQELCLLVYNVGSLCDWRNYSIYT